MGTPRSPAGAPSWALHIPLSSSVPAIGSSPKGDISAGCLYLPSDTSPKNPPGSWAAHGTQRGQTGPCSCLPSHRRLQLQEEPVPTHGLMGFKLLSDQLGAFGCREGRGRASHAGWSRRQEGPVTARRGSSGPLPALSFRLSQSCLGPGFQQALSIPQGMWNGGYAGQVSVGQCEPRLLRSGTLFLGVSSPGCSRPHDFQQMCAQGIPFTG